MWYNLVYPVDTLSITPTQIPIVGSVSNYDGKSHAIVELNTADDFNSLLNCLIAEVPDCVGLFFDGRTITPRIEGDYV